MRRKHQAVFFISAILVMSSMFTGCGLLKERKGPGDANMALAEASMQKPLTVEESEELLSDVANNWFYGQGLGETIVAIGTTVIFPPYGVYLVGNAALSLSGYEEIRVSEALPDSGEDVWNSFYDGVTSVPGRMTAVVSGEEFVSKKKAADSLEKYLHREAPAELDVIEDKSQTQILAEKKNDSIKTWR